MTYMQRQLIANVAKFKNAKRMARALRGINALSYAREAESIAKFSMKKARNYKAMI